MKQISVKVEDNLHLQIKMKSVKSGQTLNEIIVNAIKKLLEDEK